MLARSTACRQGLGRASAKATSISNMWPSRTSRLPGLTSRCASPASHSLRMIPRPSSMTPSSTSASLSSTAPAKNSVTSRYSRVWGELDKAVRAGAGQPGVAHDAQRVVLLLHQPPHGIERFLVLQLAVKQLPAELVPAVGTQVAAGGELAEQLLGWRVADRDPQRGGAGRAGQPERLDLPGGQAQLLPQGPPAPPP